MPYPLAYDMYCIVRLHVHYSTYCTLTWDYNPFLSVLFISPSSPYKILRRYWGSRCEYLLYKGSTKYHAGGISGITVAYS
jgi:hypothetical protein